MAKVLNQVVQIDEPNTTTHAFDKGEVNIIPTSNVANMTPIMDSVQPAVVEPEVKLRPGPKPKGIQSAQVSGPTHHVFTDGPGKTRD